MVTDDDIACIFRVAGGDQAALGELYDRHGAALLALGARVLRDRHEAEDLLHDVFVEVWQKAATYDPARGSVRAWLAIRMRSRALDRVRAPLRTRARAIGDDLDRIASVPPVESTDASSVLRKLASLPPEQQSVLLLGYFDGQSCSEIAESEGVPVGTVKSRMAAALSKLRAQLAEPGAKTP